MRGPFSFFKTMHVNDELIRMCNVNHKSQGKGDKDYRSAPCCNRTSMFDCLGCHGLTSK